MVALRSFNDIDPDNPAAVAQCDRCARILLHRDLIKQMEFAGNKLVWIGILVCERCVDKPQPQNQSIRLKPDPIPVKLPRPAQSDS